MDEGLHGLNHRFVPLVALTCLKNIYDHAYFITMLIMQLSMVSHTPRVFGDLSLKLGSTDTRDGGVSSILQAPDHTRTHTDESRSER